MTVPQPMKGVRAALCLRVSTPRQAEHAVSIPDQKRQGEAYCESLRDVEWRALDMPPGIGDAQLTMAQSVSPAGAIIVSTMPIISPPPAPSGPAPRLEKREVTTKLVSLIRAQLAGH